MVLERVAFTQVPDVCVIADVLVTLWVQHSSESNTCLVSGSEENPALFQKSKKNKDKKKANKQIEDTTEKLVLTSLRPESTRFYNANLVHSILADFSGDFRGVGELSPNFFPLQNAFEATRTLRKSPKCTTDKTYVSRRDGGAVHAPSTQAGTVLLNLSCCFFPSQLSSLDGFSRLVQPSGGSTLPCETHSESISDLALACTSILALETYSETLVPVLIFDRTRQSVERQ